MYIIFIYDDTTYFRVLFYVHVMEFCYEVDLRNCCFVVKETGDYLALDLGGTNFRVLLISLKGSNVEMKNKIYPIAKELMLGPGTQVTEVCVCCVYHVR